MLSQGADSFVPPSAGSRVRIRQSRRAPYAGRLGIVAGIDYSDNKGPFLVRFEDGTQFRYRAGEIEAEKEHRIAETIHWGKL